MQEINLKNATKYFQLIINKDNVHIFKILIKNEKISLLAKKLSLDYYCSKFKSQKILSFLIELNYYDFSENKNQTIIQAHKNNLHNISEKLFKIDKVRSTLKFDNKKIYNKLLIIENINNFD